MRRPRTVLACAAVALIAVPAVVLDIPVIRELSGTLLVVLAPGVATLAALRAHLDPWLAGAAALGVSAGLVAATGLALHVTSVPLDETSWVIALASITGGLCLVALARAPRGELSPATIKLSAPKRPSVRWIAYSLAAAGVIGAILLSRESEQARDRSATFANLWAVADREGSEFGVRVGVINTSPQTRTFDLLVRVASLSGLTRRLSITIEPYAEWSDTFPTSRRIGRGAVEVELKGDDGTRLRVAT